MSGKFMIMIFVMGADDLHSSEPIDDEASRL